MRHSKYIYLGGLLAAAMLVMSTISPAAIAASYQKEYQSKLVVHNHFNVQVGYAVVGQVITIDTSEARITQAKTGSMGAYATAWLWSAEWGNPWWYYDTTPYDSHGEIKIWQKISSPLWSEEGDLWNYVDYYGGNNVYVTAIFEGTAGGQSARLTASDIINLVTTIGDIITIVLGN